jgi:hypothetical protein
MRHAYPLDTASNTGARFSTSLTIPFAAQGLLSATQFLFTFKGDE